MVLETIIGMGSIAVGLAITYGDLRGRMGKLEANQKLILDSMKLVIKNHNSK